MKLSGAAILSALALDVAGGCATRAPELPSRFLFVWTPSGASDGYNLRRNGVLVATTTEPSVASEAKSGDVFTVSATNWTGVGGESAESLPLRFR